jgi:hypothetical protein
VSLALLKRRLPCEAIEISRWTFSGQGFDAILGGEWECEEEKWNFWCDFWFEVQS